MTSPDPHAQPSLAADDTGSGLAMFLIFTAAVLTVTGAVALLAVVDAWWMLPLVFAVDLSMTAVVVLTIVYVMDGRAQTIGDHVRHPPVPDRALEGRPPRRTEPVAAL